MDDEYELDDLIAADLSAFLFDLTLSTNQMTEANLQRRFHCVFYKDLLLNLSFDEDEEKGWAKALTVIHGQPLWTDWVQDDSLRVQFKNKLVSFRFFLNFCFVLLLLYRVCL